MPNTGNLVDLMEICSESLAQLLNILHDLQQNLEIAVSATPPVLLKLGRNLNSTLNILGGEIKRKMVKLSSSPFFLQLRIFCQQLIQMLINIF